MGGTSDTIEKHDVSFTFQNCLPSYAVVFLILIFLLILINFIDALDVCAASPSSAELTPVSVSSLLHLVANVTHYSTIHFVSHLELTLSEKWNSF